MTAYKVVLGIVLAYVSIGMLFGVWALWRTRTGKGLSDGAKEYVRHMKKTHGVLYRLAVLLRAVFAWLPILIYNLSQKVR